MTYRFFHAEPIRKPEDVIDHLAEGEKHWKKGRSAYELAYSWIKAGDIPGTVREVLDKCDTYRDAELLEGFFEHNTPLRTRGRDSQTDLLALVSIKDGLGVIGVEGKVDEPFGQLVRDWNDGSEGKVRRLRSLLEVLQIDPGEADDLRYQLFHRTAASIYEAQRYGARQALMLVHSFSPADASFDDFVRFAKALGTPVVAPGNVSPEVGLGGVRLRLGWVKDKPRD